MRTRKFFPVVGALLTLAAATACQSARDPVTPGRNTGGLAVGVVLPGVTTSSRIIGADDAKQLTTALHAAGLTASVKDAGGDPAAFRRMAGDFIDDGVHVLIIAATDNDTGKAVLDQARKAGITTVEYGRYTPGGRANYFLGYDDRAVGRIQADGLATCLTRAGRTDPLVWIVNGDQTDAEGVALRAGIHDELDPRFADTSYRAGPEQPINDWEPTSAGLVVSQMMSATHTRVDGLIMGDDAMAGPAIDVLKQYQINGRTQVVGQDVTLRSLRDILGGDQCMTVYKSVKARAQAAAQLAKGIVAGKPHTTNVVADDQTGVRVPAVFLPVKQIFADEVRAVVADGFVSKQALCAGALAARCAAVHVT